LVVVMFGAVLCVSGVVEGLLAALLPFVEACGTALELPTAPTGRPQLANPIRVVCGVLQVR